MLRRLASVTVSFLAVPLCAAWMAGCGGTASVSVTQKPTPPPPGPAVTGTVFLPNGQLGAAQPSILERVARFAVEKAEALTGSVEPVGRGVEVKLVHLVGNGTEDASSSTYTNDQGKYVFTLPRDNSEDTCRYMVGVGLDANNVTSPAPSNATRAFVTSTSQPDDIDFASEAAVEMILAKVNDPSDPAYQDLCAYSADDIRALVDAIRVAPGTVMGSTPMEINQAAVDQTMNDPEVQAALNLPFTTMTPTETQGTPTPTTPANTPTDTAAPTITRTPVPSNTPTFTQPATSTPTTVPPTATPTNTVPPTSTPTTPQPTATHTHTPTLTSTPTATVTPTTPAPTATATFTASSTPTATVGAPQIAIGSASGMAGSQVSVSIALTKNGLNLVTVAPLVVGYDTSVLTFDSCQPAAGVGAGKSVSTATPDAGQVRIVLEGDLAALPDGDILDCTFTINAAAAAGSTPLSFVSADLSDDQFMDYPATGTSGTITITPASGPHLTIGSASGMASDQVTVPISLTANGPTIVTVAPLVIGYDTTGLSFESCQPAAGVSAGKSVSTATPMPGQVRIVLEGDLQPLADGDILDCTFTVNSGAAIGMTPLTFLSADVSDEQFMDYAASGSSGAITVTAATGPQLQIGSASGMPGSQVTIPIALTKNGVNVVTVAPLVLGYDTGVLTFDTCSATANVSSGKSLETAMPVSGQVRIVLEGDLAPLPDGNIIDCTFTINGAAAAGTSPLTVVSADVSDDQFMDYYPTGGNGTVTITAAAGPHLTIGTASGAPDDEVTVPIMLTKNGVNAVTVAPLVIGYDTATLDFDGCSEAAGVSAGKSVSTATPMSGQLRIVLAGDLATLPDGDILDCSFTIQAGATGGDSPLQFISADLSDDTFADYTASGTDGSITVNGAPTPTPTPATEPHIAVGSVHGESGTQVNLPIMLTKNGVNAVTLAPLTLTFDPGVLSFGSCAAAADIGAGKTVTTATPASGTLKIVLEGDLTTIPDGEILDCTFTIAPDTMLGMYPVSFGSADVSDDQFVDHAASGSNGAVTVAAAGSPQITIGTASGAPGSQVSVPISLTQNGANLVTLAPLVVNFDASVLSFGSCTAAAGVSTGKTLDTATPVSGTLKIVLEGDLATLPDGEIMECTFTIGAGASGQISLLTFVSADLSDAQFVDHLANGSNGTVTVQ